MDSEGFSGDMYDAYCGDAKGLWIPRGSVVKCMMITVEMPKVCGFLGSENPKCLMPVPVTLS